MKILDLGCGEGSDLSVWGVSELDDITGVDINHDRLCQARRNYPKRHFIQCAGESLPFANGTFDMVISGVALPYMNMQPTLRETNRVLTPEGVLYASLHPYGFTLRELYKSFPRPMPTIYRAYVLINGVILHLIGRTLRFVNHRTESFQTRRGMRLASRKAGFNVCICNTSKQKFKILLS